MNFLPSARFNKSSAEQTEKYIANNLRSSARSKLSERKLTIKNPANTLGIRSKKSKWQCVPSSKKQMPLPASKNPDTSIAVNAA